MEKLTVVSLETLDIRFPTSLTMDGSDAVHVDPDYSLAYVIIHTEDPKFKGHGFAFTIGRGTEIVVKAIESLAFLVRKKRLVDIFNDFAGTWRELTNHSQFRWLGPEKGVIHMATGAIVNALWDLWAKLEGKPLWKLISDMTPEKIVSVIDFQHITDGVTPEEALKILKTNFLSRKEREDYVLKDGMPAYVTSVGWMGYSDDKIKKLCQEALAAGWTRFKMKVGLNIEDDKRRAALIRDTVGYDKLLMTDANQKWNVDEAISWMQHLLPYKPLWIEEPTSCDDVLGHLALKPAGVGVATGEHCQNRVMFKQFLASGAMQFCQIDSCRVAGVNEVLAILLLAAKYKVPVCPHAGGVGLCELVQHLAIINYICFAPSLDNVMVEFADHLHEHFVENVKCSRGAYIAPKMAGYSSEMKQSSITEYKYPDGTMWKQLFASGKVQRQDV